MVAASSVQPQAFVTSLPSAVKSPVPEKVKVSRTSFKPSPFTKTCVLSVPLISPAVVNCMNKTRLFSASGRPLGVPFKTYHAPPVKSVITKSWPSVELPEAKELIQG